MGNAYNSSAKNPYSKSSKGSYSSNKKVYETLGSNSKEKDIYSNRDSKIYAEKKEVNNIYTS